MGTRVKLAAVAAVRTGHEDLARAARSVPGRARGNCRQLDQHNPKIALVCDWLTTVGGAEQVILALHKMYPDAPIYTSQYNPKGIGWFKDADVRTGWLQIFPARLRRILPIFRQIYFSHLDLSDYDLIISITGAEAKSVKKGTATHLCYCHVPTQYYWQMYDDYIKNPGFGIFNPIVRFFFKLFVKPLRRADYKAAQLPDEFITISTHAAKQIKKYYHREATIIAPPVAVENFLPSPLLNRWKTPSKKSDFKNAKTTAKAALTPAQITNNLWTKPRKNAFIITARQVSWKRHDLAIEACIKTKQHLHIYNIGPEHDRLVQFAAGSEYIHFHGLATAAELKKQLETSKGFLFPSLEPFGIAPVEALTAGCPVIAYAEGGSRDFIEDGKNGVLFPEQTVDSLAAAIRRFNKMKFSPATVAKTALPFSEDEFRRKITKFVKDHTKNA